jgi:hypothetical protein
MNQTCQSRAVRWLWAGAFRALGVAGVLLSGSAFAADQCGPAASCTPAGPDCQQCQKVFEDAAAKLKNLDPGCCTPAANGCAAPGAAAACDPVSVCDSDKVFGMGKELGEPWTILDSFTNACGQNKLKDNGWQVGGWTQFGYSNNPDGAFTGNGIFLDDSKEWDRVNLNQQAFYIGKVADGSCGVGLGFRAEMVYGVDGNEFQSFGNNPGEYDFVNGFDHGAYEWALPQLYAEAAMGDLSVKVGHFYTPIGYEVLPAGGNFFFSKQLTFYNSEPFTHTGALATMKMSDKLTASAGWTLGMDTGFDQFAGGNSFLGGFTFVMDECTTFLNYMTAGDLGWRGNGFINSAIITRKWSDKLNTVHQFDVLGTDLSTVVTGPFGFVSREVPVDFAVNGIAHDSIGVINYAFYDINPKLKAGVRYEWYKADSVSYNTLTYGVNIKPIANLVIRPEVRHMWSPGNDIQYPSASGSTEDLFNQTVVGIDAVLTY